MDDDKLLLAGIEDKIRQCEERYMVTNTAFLDMRQRSLAENLVRKRAVKRIFWGGYEDAERCCLTFIPDFVELEEGTGNPFREYPEDEPLAVIRAEVPEKSVKPGHRDYLGALMGLGIKRECIGDILVNDTGADIVILKDMLGFLMNDFGKAGNTYLSVSQISFEEIRVPEKKTKVKTDTVASLRLDCVASSAFSVSRSSAASAIKAGLLFVNNLQVDKTDFLLKEGDVLAYRGKGKAELDEVGGKSRKDRIYIKISIYI